MPVVAIEHRVFQGKVYNFAVDQLACYAVGRNNVLVHNNAENCVPGEPGDAGGPTSQPVGRPFNSAEAEVGQTVQGVDPTSLQAGRGNLVKSRLQVQRQLVDSETPRYTPIEVTKDGVIWDGNHGVRAAAEGRKAVDVVVVPGSTTGKGNVLDLPVTER